MSTLVCLENTTNKGGGACYHLDEIKAIKKVCDENDLKLHLDGARLFNAIVANNHDPKEFGALFDTISICLSKGLGAPMGTILLGKKELMQNAMRVRKVLGGGMRQVGFAASAAYYALHHHVDRMVDDHRRAKEISDVLKTENYVSKVEKTETNIVIFYLNESVIKEAEFLSYLENNKIRISTMGEGKMRIVTHLDYSEEDHQKMLEVLKK